MDYGLWTATAQAAVTVKARSSNDPAMTGAPAWSTCPALTMGQVLSAANPCVTNGQRYIQYEATLSTTDSTITPALDDLTLNYNSTITISDTSDANFAIKQPKLTFTAQPTTATAGVAFSPTITVAIQTQAGATITADGLTQVTLAVASGTSTLSGTVTQPVVNGVATFTGLSYNKAEPITLTATSSPAATAATSGTITVGPAAAATLTVTGIPTPIATGAAANVTVTAKDQFGNVATGYTGAISFTSTDANAVLPATSTSPYTFLASDAGIKTFMSGVTFKTVGTRSVTATDTLTSSITGVQGAITVNPGAFTKLQLLVPGETAAPGTASGKTGTPTTQTAGVALTVTVNAVDANWNLVTTSLDTVGITSSDANATLPANAALVAGTKTFSVTFKTAASQTLTASDATDGTKTANTSPAFTVTPAAFTKLQLLLPGETTAPGTAPGKTGTPTAPTAGSAITVTVNAVDANWNLVTTIGDTVGLTTTDLNATLPASAALVGGTKSLAVTFKTAASQTLTASDATDATKTANTSPAFTVTPAAFTKLQLLLPGETTAPGTASGKTGTPTAPTAGVAVTVTVNAVDANWNLVATSLDTVGLTTTDLNATLPANAALVAGTKTFSVTFKTAASQTLTASDVTDGTKTANTSPGVTVNPAAAASLSITTQPSSTATAGVAFGIQPVVTLYDAFSNVASLDSATQVTLAISSGTGTLSGVKTVTVGNGVATFIGLSYNKAENLALKATSSPVTTTATSAPVAVSAASKTSFQVSGISSPILAGTLSTVTVTVLDALGNVATDYTGTIYFTSSDLQAVLPANFSFGTNSAVGSWTRTTDADFTAGTLSGTQVSGTGAATDVALSLAGPTTVVDDLGARTYRDGTATTADWDETRGVVRLKGDYTTDASLAGAWMMEEAGTTNRADATGKGNSLLDANVSMASSVEHKQGDTSAQFGGTNSALVIPASTLDSASSALRITGVDQPVTVSAWVKPTATGNQGIVAFSKAGRQHWLLALDSANKVVLSLSNDGTTQNKAIGATALTPGTWYHVMGVSNDTDIRVYVNGVLDSSATNPLAYTAGILAWNPTVTGGESNFAVGDSGETGARFFNGLIDEVAVFNRALLATEVSSVYQSGLASVVRYATGGAVQSLKVNAGTATINAAKLIASETLPAGAAISYSLSADGGITWYPVANQGALTFTVAGSDLRWKAALSTTNAAVTPTLLDVTLAYAGGYVASGTLESATRQVTGSSLGTLSWTKTLPTGTDVKFQLASNNDNATWTYKGPDGTGTTYYTTPGAAISIAHNGQKYVRSKAFLSTTNSLVTPTLSDATLTYNTTAGGVGTATFTDGVTLKTVGTQSVTATDVLSSTITGSQGNVTVNFGGPTQLGFTQQPPATLTAGGTFTVKVTVKDANGNTVTSDNATVVTLATGTKGTAMLQGTLTATAASGIATFTGLSYTRAETMNIRATSGSLTAAVSTDVAVGAAAATKVVFTTVPAGNAIGVGTRGAYTATVQDQHGNTQANHGGVTAPLSSTSASTTKKFYDAATLGNVITQLVLANGTGSGNAWYYDETTGTYTITASHATLTNATHSVTVTASAAPVRLKVTGTAAMVAGASNTITITAYDAFGNAAAGTYTGDKLVTLSGAAASPTPSAAGPTCADKTGAAIAFGTPTTLTFTNGAATCAMKLYKAEIAAIKATEGTLATADADSFSVTVRHGAADHLKLQGNIPVPLPANKFEVGVAFPMGTLVAVDLYDNVANGANGSTAYAGSKIVTYALSGVANAPDGTPADAYTNTISFTAGLSTAPTLMATLYRAQTTTIKAHDAALTGTDLASNAITVVAGPVAKLAFNQQPSTASLTNVALAQQPKVAVADQYGNPTSVLDQITLTPSLTNTTFTPVANGALTGTALTVTTSGGLATFSGVKYSYPEAIYLKASSSSGSAPDVYSFKITLSAASDSTMAAGPLTEPTTISSAASSSATQVQAFDFNLTDVGTDGLATKVRQITIKRAATDATGGWISYVAGASLSDGATSVLGAISAETITFGSATSTIFTVADATAKTVTLSLYLQPVLPAGADGKLIALSLNASSDILADAIGSTFATGGTALTTSLSVNVIATKFLVTGSASTAQAGAATTVTIKATDANNNLDAGYLGIKTLTFSGAGASSSGAKPAATNNVGTPIDFGLATLVNFTAGTGSSSVTLYKVEAASVKATEGTVATAAADALTLTVTGGAASKLSWLTQPQATVAANAPWNPFKISVADAYGNPTSSPATVTITPTGCSAGSASTNAVAAESGIAAFSNFTAACASYPATMTVNATATGLTSAGASIGVTVVEKFAITLKIIDSVNGGPLTQLTLKVIDKPTGQLVTGLTTNPITGNSPLSFSLPYGTYNFNFTKDAYVETPVERLVDVSADALDGVYDNTIAFTIPITSVAESLADYRVISDFVYDEVLDQVTAIIRLEKRGRQVLSEAINTLKGATLKAFDSTDPNTPIFSAALTQPDANGNYVFVINPTTTSGKFASGRSYFAKATIMYGGPDLALNITYSAVNTFNIGISARLKILTDAIRTDVSGVKTTVASEVAASRALLESKMSADALTTLAKIATEAASTRDKVTTEAKSTQDKVVEVKTDAAKILTAAETTLPTKIETARAEIETARKSQILTRESTVKSGGTLTIRYRTFPNLSPTIDVYDAKNVQRIIKAPMKQMGTSDIYESAVTFQSAWGKGDFTIVCSESTKGSLDALIMTVISTDIEAIAGQVSAVQGSTADISSVKTGVTDLKGATASINSQFSVLDAALSRIGGDFSSKIQGVANAASQIDAVYSQLTRMAEEIKQMSGDTGVNLQKLYDVSKDKKEDLVYVRNKTEQLKAAMEINTKLIENVANKPVVQTWFELR